MEYKFHSNANNEFHFFMNEDDAPCLNIKSNNELVACFMLVRKELVDLIDVLQKMNVASMDERYAYRYDIKCRKCGKIKEKAEHSYSPAAPEQFRKWIQDRAAIPVESECVCSPGMTTFHEVVAYIKNTSTK